MAIPVFPSRMFRHQSLFVRKGGPIKKITDLAGRRVASADLSGMAAGPHRVALLERRAVTPGVYLVRLTHGGNVTSMKVAVLQ